MSALRVVVLGASWAEPGSPLVRALAQTMAAYDVTAAGVRGASIARWTGELASRDDLRGSTAIVVEMGGNGAATRQQVLEANSAIIAKGARGVWALPPRWPVAGVTQQRRDATRRAILSAGVPIVQTGPLTAAEVSGDGVHPTRAGYTRLGVLIGRGVERLYDMPSAALFAALALLVLFLVAQ